MLDFTIRGFLGSTVGLGWLGVSLFFVLSGFCVHLPYACGRKFLLDEYVARRFLRVWPPYAMAVALGLAMGFAAGWESSSNLISSAWFHLVFWIWNFSPQLDHDAALNPVFWSIVIEVQMYLLYATLMRLGLVQRIGLRWLTLFFFLAGLLYHFGVHFLDFELLPDILEPRRFALARFGEWLLGAFIAEYSIQSVSKKGTLDVSPIMLSKWIAPALLIFVLLLGPIPNVPESLFSLAFALLFYWAIVTERKKPISEIENNDSWFKRGLRYVSERSYSIYLFHFPCLAIAGELAVRAWRIPSDTKDLLGGSLFWFCVTFVGIAFGLTVAEFCYRVVELPSHQFARRLGESLRKSDASR